MELQHNLMYTCKEATDKDADYFKGLGTQNRFRLDVSLSFPVKLEMHCVFFNGFLLFKDNETSKTRIARTKLSCLSQVEHLRRASKPRSRS